MEEIEERLEEVWRTGQDLGLLDTDIEDVIRAVLEEAKDKENNKSEGNHARQGPKSEDGYWIMWSVVRFWIKFFLVLFFLGVVAFALISLHNPTRKFVTRNIQDAIYPFMTALRVVTLPLLSAFPWMSRWYSEECLVQNPLYDQPSVDCTPCMVDLEPVVVSRLENFTDFYYNNGKFVVVVDALKPGKGVSWATLVTQFNICKEEEIGSWTLTPKEEGLCNYNDTLEKGVLPSPESHVEWKIFRLETLHVIRQFFPRIYFVPQDTEVALHRHIFIDGTESKAYTLPLTEFANVVVVQGEGGSVIKLEPSPHCQDMCPSVTIQLETSQVLFFNWIFWRPVRMGGHNISTIFMSSFY
ncbi:uncharacterized protein LOC122267327 [Penaeus japonicus]|uniref:uncharacterized protein LOC122253841 n=1 Tax=Penaeus japonicus TaxID=27405 RepID=UPI001C70FE7D|nr:uncharacterized protein LOC122253841 [Penaeus japonicus]XP_042892392.1 uncharacterized protein LOC122266662 [Penaeus japonicus]XP_042893306.1 uncharacterized protein LOC122267327 [Penaeus japonicus]